MPRANTAGYPASREARSWPAPPTIGAGLDPASGEQFLTAVSQGAVAGEFSHVQLFNPRESRRRLTVEQLVITSAANDFLILARYSEPLTTFVRRWVAGGLTGYQGVAEGRVATSVTGLGTILAQVNLLANTQELFDGLRLVLDPGEGLVWRSGSVNIQLRASFFGREYPC